jgi:GTP-binding protein HflX
MVEWNLGEKKNVLVRTEPEKAVLIGLITQNQPEGQTAEYLDELEFLAETAGATTVKRFVQKLTHPDSKTYLGSGKMNEIAAYIEMNDIDLAIFDDDLSPKQANIIEELFKIKILDRSTLILDIFASRAQTAQARTQVELAQLLYFLPRLRGLWTHLERQKGGIGMRGPGEQEIETDRRIVKEKVAKLKERLELIDRQNHTQRKNRDEMVRVSLVGYTNVGKSTLMQILSKSDVFAENKLFATLDTTVRKVVLGQMPFLLSDTVGFIRKLPHHLVESFKSTLDEVRESDFLIHVVDLSHPQHQDHLNVVKKTLEDIGAGDKPTLIVFNKMDAAREKILDPFLTAEERVSIEEDMKLLEITRNGADCLFVSAITQEGIPELREKLTQEISHTYLVRYPHITKFW